MEEDSGVPLSAPVETGSIARDWITVPVVLRSPGGGSGIGHPFLRRRCCQYSLAAGAFVITIVTVMVAFLRNVPVFTLAEFCRLHYRSWALPGARSLLLFGLQMMYRFGSRFPITTVYSGGSFTYSFLFFIKAVRSQALVKNDGET